MSSPILSRRIARASLAGALSLLTPCAFAQSLSLLDGHVVEGGFGQANLQFEARLSAPAAGPVRFDLSTSDGTATMSEDFTPVGLQTLTIPAGQTSLVMSVPVDGDSTIEENEYFNATISNVVGASLARATARGLIINDDYMTLASAPFDPTAQAAGANGAASDFTAMSRDGRFVAFISTARNLVAGRPSNTAKNIYVRDSRTGTTTLATVAANGGDADGDSNNPQLSADGRYLVFQSTATNLVAGDNNGGTDVFRRDLQTGTTVLVSVNFSGTGPAMGFSTHGSLSADGRYVAFQSAATDVVAADSNGRPDAFLRDMQTGTTRLVSCNADCSNTDFSGGNAPWVNADGRYVTFDRNGSEPWRRDMLTGAIVRVSDGFGGIGPNGNSYSYGISDDGRYVLFMSFATNLTSNGGGGPGVYVSDVEARTNVLASATDSGGWSSNAFNPSMSGDGRYVVWQTITNAAGELPDDGRRDIYLRDLQANRTTRISQNYLGGINSGGDSEFPSISGDGNVVTFLSLSPTMLPGDNNGLEDAFRVELRPAGANVPVLVIWDGSMLEGNSGTRQMSFPVSLSNPPAQDVTFDVDTADATATAGSDYVAASHVTYTIPAGATSTTVTIDINGDTTYEATEAFDLYVSNVRGARGDTDLHASGIIGNDDATPPAPPRLSIDDVSVTEGDNGTKLLNFIVFLSYQATSPVTFDIATADGSATAGSDYVAQALTGQVINPGSNGATFSVAINGDRLVEADENFSVSVSNVSGADVIDGQAVGTISNDDVLPTLSIGDVSVAEGNSGSKLATFTVQLSAPAGAPVTYDIATANGTAAAPADFTAKSLSGQVIPAGASSATFTVSINGDNTIEPDENFQVNVSGVSNAVVADGQAIGTITNDDVLPALTIADVSINEGNNGSQTATFTVSLSKAASSAVTFNIATANGTAVAPGDYTAKSATGQSIAAGALSKTFAVAIKGDKTVEPNETFFVNVSNVAGNVTVADAQAIGTIVNDDASKLTLSRVTTGGLYDDVDDRHADPVIATKDYALLLLDSAQQVCARAGGAGIVAIDGVESLRVLADLADTANRLCARQPNYGAVLKQGGLGFLVDGIATRKDPGGTQVLEIADAKSGVSEMTLQVPGHARPLTVLLAATPSAVEGERNAQVDEINRLVHARLAADPQSRLVVLGAGGLSGLVDLTARSLPGGDKAGERVWVSAAVLSGFGDVRLDLPKSAAGKPAQQVLQLQP